MGEGTRFRSARRTLHAERTADLVDRVSDEVEGRRRQVLFGPHAVGLSGEDAGLFTARRRPAVVDGEEVDVGLVGDVVAVDPTAVHDLLEAGRIQEVWAEAARHAEAARQIEIVEHLAAPAMQHERARAVDQRSHHAIGLADRGFAQMRQADMTRADCAAGTYSACT